MKQTRLQQMYIAFILASITVDSYAVDHHRNSLHHISNDIMLIHKIDSRSVAALRAAGIRTLADLVNVDITSLPKIPYAPLPKLQKFQLQAEALLENKVIQIHDLRDLPNAPLKIYFDIEGHPYYQIEYLFGFWITGEQARSYAQSAHATQVREYPDNTFFIYFLAEKPEQEKNMWQNFLNWISCLPDNFCVYHYANYEKTRLNTLSAKYGTTPDLLRFQNKLVDLLRTVENAILFPLTSYGLKEIASSRFINYKWRHTNASGALSVFWFEQWLLTGNRKILENIIDYNEDDVRATHALFNWLSARSAVVKEIGQARPAAQNTPNALKIEQNQNG